MSEGLNSVRIFFFLQEKINHIFYALRKPLKTTYPGSTGYKIRRLYNIKAYGCNLRNAVIRITVDRNSVKHAMMEGKFFL
jgi:hypothetical protein